MLYKLSILVGLIILISSCKADRSTESEGPVIVEIPEDFPEFYHRFHRDSAYQLDHIIFPLSETADGRLFEKKDWQLHKPLAGNPAEFILDYQNFSGIIIETIIDTAGIFNMERRFSKSNGEWNLIYSKVKTTVF